MTSVRDFGAKGDGKTDDTRALQHAFTKGEGTLLFPPGNYLITRPLVARLNARPRFHLSGSGGTARLIMAGAGPALHLIGTHPKTASPKSVAEGVWLKERLPTVDGIEILGKHKEADGLRLEGSMQPTLTRLLIRQCRHGIHLRNRDRNVLIANCHIYDNASVGIFLDRVNLHQIVIEGNHISYCKQAGILVAGSEVRNIQICGNDIEYNYDSRTKGCADIFFDARAGTVREGTIVGNTIQARRSPEGANIRLLGVGKGKPNAVGLLAITGNLIGSQESALYLSACRGVTVAGNCIYSGYRHALLAEDAEHLVVSGNSIDHNPEYRGKSTDQLVLRRCRHVNLTGLLCQHTLGSDDTLQASIDLEECSQVNLTSCQVIGARVRGVHVRNSSMVRIADSTVRPREGDRTYRAAVSVDAKSTSVMVVNNFVSKGTDGVVQLPEGAGQASGNMEV